MMTFVLKMMTFVIQMMNFASKMMDFNERAVLSKPLIDGWVSSS